MKGGGSVKKLCFIISGFLLAMLINFNDSYAITPISEPNYQGIDVSNWQGYIDYASVARSGIQVVYMKASQGTTYRDPFFNYNYENAKANGLKVGFYHYLTATNTEQAEQQARFFASVIAGKTPDCKLVMDYETFGGVGREQVNQIARTFLENVQRLTNKEVIVYSNLSNARDRFDVSLARDYQLWLAYYGDYNQLTNVETSWSNWIGVQYTSMGRVPGVNTNVDRNNFTQDIFLGETTESPTIENPMESDNTETIEYIVKKGDTLSQIANRYCTTVEQIAQVNGIANPNLIYPGQVFKIFTNSCCPGTDTGELGGTVYTVKRGDTLSHIALKYGVTVNALVEKNGIKNPNLIFPGERIRI